MNIEIADKYRLTSDSLQIVIQRKHTVDPTKSPIFDETKHSPEIRTEWRDWKYASKPEHALELILRQNVFESDATDLRTLRNEIVEFKREISAQFDGE